MKSIWPDSASHDLTVILLLALLGSGGISAEERATPDSFEDVLRRMGVERSDLAVTTPAVDWLGQLAIENVPFLLPHVADTRRDPLYLATLGNNLLFAGHRALGDSDPTAAPGSAPRAIGVGHLLTTFGLQPRLPGLRGFLLASPDVEAVQGSLTSVLALWPTPSGPARPEAYSPKRERSDGDGVAGMHHTGPTISPAEVALTPELGLPASLRQPIAQALAALWRAGTQVEISWRQRSQRELRAIFEISQLPMHLIHGDIWWPALEDAGMASGDVDRAASALRLASALETISAKLEALAAESFAGFGSWQTETPWGRVLVAGTGNDTHRCRHDCLLIVDLGGNDTYLGSAAGAVYPEQPVSAVLDLGGEDRYLAEGLPAQGSGLGGVGVLLDRGGNDFYRGTEYVQGFGLLGYGILRDSGGDNQFEARSGAQGAAVIGAGLLIAGKGSDRYRLLGEGQGFGGVGGCGALIDAGGNDDYFAQADPATHPERADSHSGGRVAANFAQGAAAGRRGDLTDGHSWAGGLGVLADFGGDDTYTAGNFAQGVGYWLGTGMLLDAAGNDIYRSVYFSQGSGAHFSQALLYDLAGDDQYLLDQEAGAALGYGWDWAVSLFLEAGGNDRYEAKKISLGAAHRNSAAFFLELGGDDHYIVSESSARPGFSGFGFVDMHPKEGKTASSPRSPFPAGLFAGAIGLFVDLAGEDDYGSLPSESSDKDHRYGNGKQWSWRRTVDPTLGRFVGAGIDLDGRQPAEPLRWLFGGTGY